MPNRDLKESNRRSRSLQLLSDAAERLWYRLITAVDDFGRLEADPEVVFTTCFQRVPKGWTVKKVQLALDELATKSSQDDQPLITIYYALYHAKRKAFLQILSASEHIYCRAKESKYPSQENQPLTEERTPMCADAGNCTPILSVSELRTPNSELRTPSLVSKKLREDEEGIAVTKTTTLRQLENFILTPDMETWAATHAIPNPEQYLDEFKDYWRSAGGKRKNGQLITDWAAAFRNQLRRLKDTGKLKHDWTKDWEAQA